MNKYTVDLSATADVQATVEVQATNRLEAENKAISEAKEGNLVWSYNGTHPGSFMVSSIHPDVQMYTVSITKHVRKTKHFKINAESEADARLHILDLCQKGNISWIMADEEEESFEIG